MFNLVYFSLAWQTCVTRCIISAKDIKSVHDHNAIIEQKFQQQNDKLKKFKSTSDYEETLPSKSSVRSVSSCARFSNSQSYGDLTEQQRNYHSIIYADNSDVNKLHDVQNSTPLKRAKSYDDSLSHSSSFVSNTLIKEPLSREVCSNFYSHNDSLMTASKQRQFEFLPESAPYSRISSSSGMYTVWYRKNDAPHKL